MLPKKALEELAASIRSTPEYTEVIKLRKKIFGIPQLGSLLQNFEREHTRILSLGTSEEQIDMQLKKLYSDNKSFLENQQIKEYVTATQKYQEMISGSMRYLNQMLDIKHGR
jgi:cell fate (sporulation/competence/biofilm development) regulator YlbF (YheA/YmcA/DUF963 family)